MVDRSLAQLTPTEQTFEPDRHDPLYWALRRENDEFLRRRQWWGRHFANGTLLSQRRRAANELGTEGEEKAAEMIRERGLKAHLTTKKCAFDLWVEGPADGQAARVEVKTSLYQLSSKGGRYEANIRHDSKEVDLIIFLAKNGSWWPYVIPSAAVGQRHNIAIWSACPGDYKGQWSIYLNAWQHLDQVIANTQPRQWQSSMPFTWKEN